MSQRAAPTRMHSASDALAMLKAASEAVCQQHQLPPLAHAPLPPTSLLPPLRRLPSPQQHTHPSNPPPDLRALLNPMPPNSRLQPPPGFVLGKDGKLRKKRGRKPTPGLSDEQRRQARLLKNRRTAETSRRRKIALMNSLNIQRDHACEMARSLSALVDGLQLRLATEMKLSVAQLLQREPRLRAPDWPQSIAQHGVGVAVNDSTREAAGTPEQSDVSRAPSVAESEEESSSCNGSKRQSVKEKCARTN